MVDTPSAKDALVNLFLMLYVVFEATKRGEIDGRVKLMKLLQKSEEELTKKNMRGLSYVFYKWKHGAWCPEAQAGMNLLLKTGLIAENLDLHQIMIVQPGLELIAKSRTIIEKNRELLNIVDKILASHVQFKSWQLRALTYGTPSLEGDKRLIGEMDMGEVVLLPIPENKASKFFLVDDEWLDRLAMTFSDEFHNLVGRVEEKPIMNQYDSLGSVRKEYGPG